MYVHNKRNINIMGTNSWLSGAVIASRTPAETNIHLCNTRKCPSVAWHLSYCPLPNSTTAPEAR